MRFSIPKCTPLSANLSDPGTECDVSQLLAMLQQGRIVRIVLATLRSLVRSFFFLRQSLGLAVELAEGTAGAP